MSVPSGCKHTLSGKQRFCSHGCPHHASDIANKKRRVSAGISGSVAQLAAAPALPCLVPASRKGLPISSSSHAGTSSTPLQDVVADTPDVTEQHIVHGYVVRPAVRTRNKQMPAKVHKIDPARSSEHGFVTLCLQKNRDWLTSSVSTLPADIARCAWCFGEMSSREGPSFPPELYEPTVCEPSRATQRNLGSTNEKNGNGTKTQNSDGVATEWLMMQEDEQHDCKCNVDKDFRQNTRRRKSGGLITAVLPCGLLIDWLEIWYGESLRLVFLLAMRILSLLLMRGCASMDSFTMPLVNYHLLSGGGTRIVSHGAVCWPLRGS